MGVDVRTVERDIARLRDAGVPITTRRGPAAASTAKFPGPSSPVHLPGEIAALIASVGPYLSATARSAFTRLIEALQPRR